MSTTTTQKTAEPKKNGSETAQQKPSTLRETRVSGEADFLNWDDEGSLPDVAGFYQPTEKGPWVAGTIKGFVEFEDRDTGEPRTMIILKVAQDTVAVESGAEEGETVVVDKGDYLGVSARSGMRSVFECGPGTRIAFQSITCKKIGRGKTMWSFNVRIDPATRCKRPATEARAKPERAPRGRRGGGGYTRSVDPDDNDDVQF